MGEKEDAACLDDVEKSLRLLLKTISDVVVLSEEQVAHPIRESMEAEG